MFATLRKELNIVEVVEFMTDTYYNLTGESTYVPDGDECPSCGHNNCFRIKHEGNNEEAFAKCFSESKTWDVTSIVAQLKGISNIEAAKLLAKHYSVTLPNDYSPLQEALNLATDYYHNLLDSTGPQAELNGLTPREYQEQIRKHSPDSLQQFQIGWSDGNLIDFLTSVGVSEEIIKDSGLVNKKGKDFLPSKVFIYPHFVRGRASHFTFKDPLKQKAYQLPNKYKLNGHSFYNSDSINKPGIVAVSEGENDAISLLEHSWTGSSLCCNGSISAAQLEWMSVNLKGKDVVTFFDADPAGDTYREKVSKLSRHFKSLLHVVVSGGCKDVDEYLKKGGDLAGLISSAKMSQPTSSENDVGVESDSESELSPIIVKNGSYFKVGFKDGNEFHKPLTNFTVELSHIYIRGIRREREVILTLNDGRRSSPIIITSEDKVSMKSFKTLAANAIDGSYYGTEADLTSIWEHVYSNSEERIVHLIEQVGRVEDFSGWIFKDCFVSDSGGVYRPDDSGVMWITSSTVGIKPISLVSIGNDTLGQAGIPSVNTILDRDERKALLGTVIKALAANIGDMGEALTMLGWCHATLYSKMIHRETGFFPHIHCWGAYGKGKTWIMKFLLDIFDMSGPGFQGLSSLNSGVAFSRKMAYYTSLPICIDEIRNNKETADWYGTFRELYTRDGRSIGARDGFGVKVSPVNTTIMFCGEDAFHDPATRSRCISIRLRKNRREMVNSFKVLDRCKGDVASIGYEWILNYGNISKEKLIEEFQVFRSFLTKTGIDSRQAGNWAVAGVFANKLCQEYCPEYNYTQYLVAAAAEGQSEQLEESVLEQFWKIVEGMQAAEKPVITSDHLKREGSYLYVWFADIFRLFEKDGINNNRQKFSRNAMIALLREEDYFVKEDRVVMGMGENYRRCIVVDIDKVSDTLQSIAAFLDK